MLKISSHFGGMVEVQDIMAKFGLEDHGRVQMAIDQAIIDYMVPYWAWETGTLANSAYGATDVGSGEIVYSVPYAYYQAMGVSKTGAPLNYNLATNPLAGAYPFERMIADHSQDIIEEAKRVALGK